MLLNLYKHLIYYGEFVLCFTSTTLSINYKISELKYNIIEGWYFSYLSLFNEAGVQQLITILALGSI